MTIEEIIAEIKKNHKGNFSNLWKIYSLDGRFIKSFQLWGSIILTAIFIVVIFFSLSSADILVVLCKLSNKILSLLPSILGFTLTGYVLLIGFSSSEVLEGLTVQNDGGYSFFQHFSSIFCWNIIIQACTFFITFIVSFIADLSVVCHYANFINSTVLVIVMLFSFYSILLIIRLVLNVFSFGQVVQYHYTEKNLINVNEDDSKRQSEMDKKTKKSN
jgi:hypothetical protein